MGCLDLRREREDHADGEHVVELAEAVVGVDDAVAVVVGAARVVLERDASPAEGDADELLEERVERDAERRRDRRAPNNEPVLVIRPSLRRWL